MNEIDTLFAEIRARLAEVHPGSAAADAIVAHLRSLARRQEPQDYVDPGRVQFPAKLAIAYAVCHPECGTAEFIVEGSTQECQRCGGLLFRIESRDYALAESAS